MDYYRDAISTMLANQQARPKHLSLSKCCLETFTHYASKLVKIKKSN